MFVLQENAKILAEVFDEDAQKNAILNMGAILNF
jgi:hypothetical protein